MYSFKPRRALLPTVSWGASFSPLKKRLKTSVRVRAPKAAGAHAFTLKSTTSASKRGVRTSLQPRIWGAAPILLAAALVGCNQQAGVAKETAPAPAASRAAAVQKPAAAPAASAAASAASEAQGAELTPEGKAVKQRAQERWDALVARDFERAWAYLEPAKRKEIEQKDYKDKFGEAGGLLGVEVLNVKCTTGRCAAFVRLNAQMGAPGFAQGKLNVTTHSEEEWVLQDGQWWYRGKRQAMSGQGEEPLPSAAPPHPRQPPASGWGGGVRS